MIRDLPAELVLKDPGLVENTLDAEHCVHACFQMIFRTRVGGAVPSFADLDILMDKVPGKYTWEYGLLAQMPDFGFETRVIWGIDLALLRDKSDTYLTTLFGQSVGQEYIDNSDLAIVSGQAGRLLASDVSVEQRSPSLDEVVSLIADGYYLTITINQRILQADPGYAAHSIVIYGVSRRGLRVHNPGPPSAAAAEIPWDLFDKAWSYPNEAARNVMALRPLTEVER